MELQHRLQACSEPLGIVLVLLIWPQDCQRSQEVCAVWQLSPSLHHVNVTSSRQFSSSLHHFNVAAIGTVMSVSSQHGAYMAKAHTGKSQRSCSLAEDFGCCDHDSMCRHGQLGYGGDGHQGLAAPAAAGPCGSCEAAG